MSLLETLQYEKELMELRKKLDSGRIVKWYKENPDELKKKNDELNSLKYRVINSGLKYHDADSILEGIDKSLELLNYKETSSSAGKENNKVLDYIMCGIAGISLIQLILDGIFPESQKEKAPEVNYEEQIKKMVQEVFGNGSSKKC